MEPAEYYELIGRLDSIEISLKIIKQHLLACRQVKNESNKQANLNAFAHNFINGKLVPVGY